jgi:hypothetical protein
VPFGAALAPERQLDENLLLHHLPRWTEIAAATNASRCG